MKGFEKATDFYIKLECEMKPKISTKIKEIGETENANTKFVNTCSVGVSRMRKCRDMITWTYRRC